MFKYLVFFALLAIAFAAAVPEPEARPNPQILVGSSPYAYAGYPYAGAVYPGLGYGAAVYYR